MPNKNGKSYGLTALFPIKGTVADEPSQKESLRSYLADLPRDESSPFAKSVVTHFTRFAVVDKLAYNGEPGLPDHLQSAYLLWTACFNGDLEPWLDTLWQDAEMELQTILNACVAYDLYSGLQGFKDYVKRCQITTSFLFADYPNDTLPEILEGLKLKKHFTEFMVDNQQSDAASLKANFLDWMEAMQNTPSPKPGMTY